MNATTALPRAGRLNVGRNDRRRAIPRIVSACFFATVAVRAHGAAELPLSASVSSNRAAIIAIHGEINQVMFETTQRRVAEALRTGVSTIVFDLDTPGGSVASSLAIADAIKELTQVHTVAWVNPNAESGGTVVAVACDEIVMARSSRMGNVQVILGGFTGAQAVPEELRAKAYSPVLGEFRASAKLRGYDQVLCEAFVVPEREVWWIENTKTGERRFVFRDEKARRLREAENSTADLSEPGDAVRPEWKLVETYFDPVLNAETSVRQPIDRDDENLQMSAGEASAYGFCKGIVSSESDLKARYALADLRRLDVNWSESLAGWLTSIYVRGFLLAVFLLSLYVEFHTPGLGLAGIVAIVSLALFVGAPYMTGLANIWEILVIVIGLVLLAVEIFVLPGFGVAGIAGLALVLIGLVATFVPDEPGRGARWPFYLPSVESAREALKIGILTVSASVIGSAVGMIALARILPRMTLFRAFVPENPAPSQVAEEDAYFGAARVGDVGEAVGSLRPSGKARFGSMIVDVVTRGDYLEEGTAVEVVERRGNRVIVREKIGIS